MAGEDVMTASANVIVDQLGVHRDGRWLFRGLSFTAEAGSVTAVVGPPRTGKSTLLDIVGGFMTPTEGSTTTTDSVMWTAAARCERPHAESLLNVPDPAPSLVIADDPTAHLQPGPAAVLASDLEALACQGAAVLTATHDRHLIAIADHVIDLAAHRV